MVDISAAGAKVTIIAGGEKIEISHFSDEGTPFEAPDADFSNNQKNLNGDMISSRSPSVFTVSVTVVPNTKEDYQLTSFAQKNALQPENVTPINQLIVSSIELRIPMLNKSSGEAGVATSTFKWTNGRLKSGPTGPSSSSEGRLAARTFTFEMEKFDQAGNGGYSW